jgi:thioredoxin-related protein
MKHFILSLKCLSLVLLAGVATAQASDSAAPTDKPRGEVTWLTNLDEAKALAAESNRLVLMNFTGSDWCPPCMQLKRDILATPEFAVYAADKLVLLELDFPRRTALPEQLQRQNRQLSIDFSVDGFPTLVLLDPQGKELTRSVGYMRGGPKQFVAWAEKARSK